MELFNVHDQPPSVDPPPPVESSFPVRMVEARPCLAVIAAMDFRFASFTASLFGVGVGIGVTGSTFGCCGAGDGAGAEGSSPPNNPEISDDATAPTIVSNPMILSPVFAAHDDLRVTPKRAGLLCFLCPHLPIGDIGRASRPCHHNSIAAVC